MREEKEIREALKRLKDEHLRRAREPGSYSPPMLIAKQFVDFLIETQRVRIDKNLTAETRARMSARAKQRWQNPEYRARQSAASKRHWQDPEYRAKQSAAHIGKHRTDETRARMSARAKQRWQNPEYRARQSAAHIGKHHTAETRAKISALLKRWHNKRGMSYG